MIRVHATCIAVDGIGILLRAAPGGGKSDLALRLIEDGAALVADDQVMIEYRQAALFASAPASTAGRIEVRGLGIVTVPSIADVPLGLAVDLVGRDLVERMPERSFCTIERVRLRRIRLHPFDCSAPAKVRLAVRLLSPDIHVCSDPRPRAGLVP